MKPAPPVMRRVAIPQLDSGSFRILKREPQLLGERIDRRAAALPGPFGLEPQVADAPAPRRDRAADRPEVGPIGVLLVQPADDVRSNANESAQRLSAANAVLPAVPGSAEDERDLLEVVDEEL